MQGAAIEEVGVVEADFEGVPAAVGHEAAVLKGSQTVSVPGAGAGGGVHLWPPPALRSHFKDECVLQRLQSAAFPADAGTNGARSAAWSVAGLRKARSGS
jgi:hypothetical protein